MPGNGLFFEKSNDELIRAARREEDLGGGRASWLVPFDVISRYPYKPTARGKREKKHEGRGNVTPPKSPPREEKTGGREEKG